MQIPDNLALLSFFETEPELLDSAVENLPFVYNHATYRFSSPSESFQIVLAPAANQFCLTVTDSTTNEVVAFFELQNSSKIEIVSDTHLYKSMMVTMEQEEIIQTIELQFKPRFKMLFKEHLQR